MLVFAVMTKAILGLVLLSALAGTGCGSSDGGSQPTLDGIWQAQLGDGCVGVYSFRGTNSYTDDLACPLANGNFGTEIEDGTFSASATEISFAPVESSCPMHSGASTAQYSIQGSQLIISFTAANVILERVTSTPTGTGSVSLDGCWDISKTPGLFTPGAITQL